MAESEISLAEQVEEVVQRWRQASSADQGAERSRDQSLSLVSSILVGGRGSSGVGGLVTYRGIDQINILMIMETMFSLLGEGAQGGDDSLCTCLYDTILLVIRCKYYCYNLKSHQMEKYFKRK